MSLAEINRLSRELEECKNLRMEALKVGDWPTYRRLLLKGVDIHCELSGKRMQKAPFSECLDCGQPKQRTATDGGAL